jgi:hypothetical protein
MCPRIHQRLLNRKMIDALNLGKQEIVLGFPHPKNRIDNRQCYAIDKEDCMGSVVVGSPAVSCFRFSLFSPSPSSLASAPCSARV